MERRSPPRAAGPRPPEAPRPARAAWGRPCTPTRGSPPALRHRRSPCVDRSHRIHDTRWNGNSAGWPRGTIGRQRDLDIRRHPRSGSHPHHDPAEGESFWSSWPSSRRVGLLTVGRLVRAARSAAENNASEPVASSAPLRAAQKAGDEEPAKTGPLDVFGRVRDGKGQPIAGARSSCRSAGTLNHLRATTDAEGRFVFASSRPRLQSGPLEHERRGSRIRTIVDDGRPERRDPAHRLPTRRRPTLPRPRARLQRAAGRRGVRVRPMGGVLFPRLEGDDRRRGAVRLAGCTREGEIEFDLRHPGYNLRPPPHRRGRRGKGGLDHQPPGSGPGSVLDAESNQPVAAFTVIPAMSFAATGRSTGSDVGREGKRGPL